MSAWVGKGGQGSRCGCTGVALLPPVKESLSSCCHIRCSTPPKYRSLKMGLWRQRRLDLEAVREPSPPQTTNSTPAVPSPLPFPTTYP